MAPRNIGNTMGTTTTIKGGPVAMATSFVPIQQSQFINAPIARKQPPTPNGNSAAINFFNSVKPRNTITSQKTNGTTVTTNVVNLVPTQTQPMPQSSQHEKQ